MEYETQDIFNKTPGKITINIGDILSSNWGYEQTNVNWYQVIKTTAKTVTVREIGCKVTETGPMCGESIPFKDKFIGEPMRRKVSKYGSIAIASYEYARLWNGNPEFVSWWH